MRGAKKFEDRMVLIMAELARQDDPQSRLLENAYRWFYETGRYDFKAKFDEDHFDYSLDSYKLFDALLMGKGVVEANTEAKEERAAYHRRNPGVLSMRISDSDVSVSPTFDEMFQAIPAAYRSQVVENLKSLAALTNGGPGTGLKKIQKKLRRAGHFSVVQVAPGIDLVVEMETVGVCFMGFWFATLARAPLAQVKESEGIWPKIIYAVWAVSLVALMAALVFVPHDVVLVSKGDNLRAFSGYDFVWSKPDISRVCDWYTNVESKKGEEYWLHRNCYSQIDTSRVLLSSGAAFAFFLVASLLGWTILRRRL
jgi:hypothetical protein